MSSYSEGQTHLLMDALEAKGFTAGHITKLGQFINPSSIMNVLDGTAKIVPIVEDTIRVLTINQTTIAMNLAVAPKLSFNGAEVESHEGVGWAVIEKRADGLFVNGRKVVLQLSKRQQNGKVLKGYELREEITGKSVLNANVLDALCDNPHLIPEEWKKDEQGRTRYIFFWGTIYINSDSNLHVRYLYWNGGRWDRLYDWLDYDWGDVDPAVVSTS